MNHDTDTVVEVSNLTRDFRGTRALDDVSLTIAADSITGLMGRNGAGKTTLMSLLTAQDFATSGSIKVFGEDPVENESVLARTCFIRESQQYPNNFRVKHVLAAGASFHANWDRDLAETLVEEFALPRRREVAKLSRGMRSALGILVGLASRAPLTIFDEPYLGLDATARQQFYDTLLKDYAEQPRTIVLSTHLIDEVGGLLENVIVLDQGRVILDGSADELRSRACVLTGPLDAVESLVSALPVLHRERFGGHEAVTIEVRPDAALRSRIAGLGVEIGPVSLQTLVVHAGQGPRRNEGSMTEGGAR
ncbi:MAG TPA: ABC transporter ATP-binding protein [Marmoricola sp.]|jgi:ABC-2 type transport system ATP-binding protein|nr:ABC transporter ATP-binding protein [Marmoricola sp.]